MMASARVCSVRVSAVRLMSVVTGSAASQMTVIQSAVRRGWCVWTGAARQTLALAFGAHRVYAVRCVMGSLNAPQVGGGRREA